jgi:signal transduction histidine kinase
MTQRPQEIPTLVAVQRLSMVVLVACALLSAGRSQPWVWVVVLAFGVTASANLWRVMTGRASSSSGISYYWAAALFPVLIGRGIEGGALFLVLLLYPLTMCTLLHGLRHGLLLGAGAAVIWLVDFSGAPPEWRRAPVALAFLLLPLITWFISAPIAAQRQRVQLVAELEQALDPRRGLAALGLAVSERLRETVAARRVLVCHRDAEAPTVLVSDSEDGSFVASAALSGRVLALLARLPTAPQAFQASNGFISNGLERRHQSADQKAQAAPLKELSQLLEAEVLQLVPDGLGVENLGWTLVAYNTEAEAKAAWPLQPLAGFAADLRPLLQQASYVDRLHEEMAAHERSRIGRDLHDSALQPYLGLKFAIEGLALRCAADNPLHASVQELRSVCDAELVELRKTVSALRAGDSSGENSLVMALQRQCTRFARLFDIQVELQVPADIAVSRILVSALLHMVNEALNNVRRHTPARNVWISLTAEPGVLRLSIRDDAGQRSGTPMPAFEPRSLTERAVELGGTLEVRQHQGLNTEVHITLPT